MPAVSSDNFRPSAKPKTSMPMLPALPLDPPSCRAVMFTTRVEASSAFHILHQSPAMHGVQPQWPVLHCIRLVISAKWEMTRHVCCLQAIADAANGSPAVTGTAKTGAAPNSAQSGTAAPATGNTGAAPDRPMAAPATANTGAPAQAAPASTAPQRVSTPATAPVEAQPTSDFYRDADRRV